MTKREAIIISAYTDVLCCDFADLHKYIEELHGRPVLTHEMGNEEFCQKTKQLATKDFLAIYNSLTD